MLNVLTSTCKTHFPSGVACITLQELTPPGPLSSSDYGTPYELIDWVLYYFRYKRPLVPFLVKQNLSGNYNWLKCVQPKVAQPVW